MTFVLAVWDADQPPGVEDAQRRYEQMRNDQERAPATSPGLSAFAEECARRWPDDAGQGGGALVGRRTSSGLLADIRPDAAAVLFGALAEMAERHGLVLYDPQSGIVKIPSRLSFDARPPPLAPAPLGRQLARALRRRRRDRRP